VTARDFSSKPGFSLTKQATFFQENEMQSRHWNRVMMSAGLMLAFASAGAQQTANPSTTAAPPQAPAAEPQRKGGGLGLTADQKAQIKSIREDSKTQANAIRNNSSLSQQQKKEQLKSLHHATHERVEGVMTPEQRAKFEARHKKHHRRGGRHRKSSAADATGPATPPPPGTDSNR
jgi:periplasmic protein CpxP/Spy